MGRAPLFLQVAHELRSEIARHPQGTRLETDTGLAKRFAVSVSVIREALSILVREGWIIRHVGRGTFVAGEASRVGFSAETDRNDQHVALLLEADIASGNLSPFYIQLLQALRLTLLKQKIPSRPYLGHLRLGVEIGELTCREFFDELGHNRVSGVIALLAKKHPSWVTQLQQRSIPLVGTCKSADIAVTVDYEKLALDVLSFFQSRGHRNMAMLGTESGSFIFERLRFHAASYGIRMHPGSDRYHVSGLDASEGVKAVERIWSDSARKPDCFYIESDLIFDPCAQAVESLADGGAVGLATCGSDAVQVTGGPNRIHCRFSVEKMAQTLVGIMKKCQRGETVAEFNAIPFSVICEQTNLFK